MTRKTSIARRPNIILVLNDDHAAWALRAYGNSEIQTPTLDYLSATGVVMENAFTPIPVCSPARASLLTGRMPSQHGVHDYLGGTPKVMHREWLKEEITLPILLSDSGYETAFCGKWHLGNDVKPQSGYDHWYALSGDYPIPHKGLYRYSNNGNIELDSSYRTAFLTDKAIDFLGNRDESMPFFLHLGYIATHHPWSGHSDRLVSRYRNCTFSDIPDDIPYPFGVQALESTFETRNDPSEALSQYYAGVTEIDEGMARIVDYLESSGITNDTLIVFTSDHGLCCGHHGIWGKGNGTLPLNMVEEAIRVPLILWDPGLFKQPQRRTEFVDHLDLFQLLAEIAQVELPSDRSLLYPGRSFLHLLLNDGKYREWRTVQYGEYGNLRMIRTKRHKLVIRYPDGPCELFDLEIDPRETTSLYTEPDCQSLVETLKTQMENHFNKYEDPKKTGLRVKEHPRHNETEAWRVESKQ